MPSRFARKERPRILVVEDHGSLREILTALLIHAGYEVVAVRSIGEALGCLETLYGPYAGVVCDLMLPDGNGSEVIRAIRESPHMADTRIVVCSAADRGGRMVMDAIRAGADAIHYKPISFADEADNSGKVPRAGLLSVMRGEHVGDVVIDRAAVTP